MSDYTASSIRILRPAEVAERFVWQRAAELAARYPHCPESWLLRLLEACELSGCPEEVAIRRYCEGDLTATVPPELIECHRELAKAAQGR